MCRVALRENEKDRWGTGRSLATSQVPEMEETLCELLQNAKENQEKRKAITRSLLLLLNKLNTEMDRLETGIADQLTTSHHKPRATAKKVFQQQNAYFHKAKKPKDRIVSLDRPYIRPIVRSKEIKPVEFGAKVNKFQIDGISFIEHLSLMLSTKATG